MAVYPWPLHVAFFASSPFLEQLADDVEAGAAPSLPRWAGFFHIIEVDTEQGRVALVTDPNRAGRSALVRVEQGPMQESYYGPMHNLNWDHHISGRWRYQNED